MRLWHWKLLPYLPKLQILAQWRELNSIFKKQDRHILINYIYEYDCMELYRYSLMVIEELDKRGIRHDNTNMKLYFEKCIRETLKEKTTSVVYNDKAVFARHHDDSYLRQCFYNLQEKFDRGQSDFTYDIYMELFAFVSSQVEIPDKIYQHSGKYDLKFIEMLCKK